MLRKKFGVIGLILCLFGQITIAQVVNVEKKRKGDENGFAGIIGMGFFLIDNGKHITQIKNEIDLQYKSGPHTFILLNDLSLMTVDEDDLINSGFQHIRYNYTIKDSSFITIEAFAQHQYNAIKLLKKRFLAGAGPRMRLLHSQKLSCYLGLIGMYEYEELTDSLNTISEFARLGSYLSLYWGITNNLAFNNITYYQPAFEYLNNYRVSSETTFQLRITKSLSFKIGLQTNYDSNPPENVQKLFYFWENSLSYEF
jgi:putative salt-induced outer membrane protein YdiY